MNNWKTIALDTIIEKTATSLEEHGIAVIVVDTPEEAKKTVLKLIPQKAEVMTMTSETLKELGLETELNTSGNYDSVKTKLMTMDRKTQGNEMQKLGAAADYSIGSVHAVTEDGKVLIASNSGSQLPGYAYGSPHVVWVVGAQKLVKDLDEGMKRIYEYVLPLESERAHKAYGVSGSFVSKLLIFNKEIPGRITMIIVKQPLGF
ncbi:MAG: lactate utilization protein [Candidatus Levybacteria bacterium]|nr:lactate utilization protein [Candidatus Levybacteria bacterium]